MSFERIRVPGLADDHNDLANHLLSQLDHRMERNLLRASFYDGKRAARQISAVVPPMYHQIGLVLGWAAKGVDALGRRCRIDGFRWPDGDLDSLGMTDFSEENQLLAEISAATTNHLKLGVAFLINTTGAVGEPKSLLHVRDAMSATGVWNPRLRRLDAAISILGRKDNRVVEFVLYLPGRTISCAKLATGWAVTGDQTHPYGMPVEAMPYKPQTREFGSSRITRPIMGLQDAAVRTLIRMEGHMDIYSYPELITLGADASVFKDASGNTLPVWQVMMGRAKFLPDDEEAKDGLERADVKQFPATSPAPHLAQLNALAKLFAREASLPDSAVAITDVANPTSADAYDASQYELIAEAEGVVDDMDRPVGRAIRRGLQILNGLSELPPQWRTISPKWSNPRYESRAQAADAGAKQLAALPWLAETSVGLELLGLEEGQITRALAERRRAEGRQVVAAALGVADGDGN